LFVCLCVCLFVFWKESFSNSKYFNKMNNHLYLTLPHFTTSKDKYLLFFVYRDLVNILYNSNIFYISSWAVVVFTLSPMVESFIRASSIRGTFTCGTHHCLLRCLESDRSCICVLPVYRFCLFLRFSYWILEQNR
jgi:hypothetical protein